MKPDEALSLGTEARLRRRHVSEAIIERVIRLNPAHKPGDRLRGIYRTSMRDGELVWAYGSYRKGEFIRKFGREAWTKMPRAEITKCGRREYVRREAVEDCLWMLP